MRVLVVGGGGREHALCASLARSPRLTRLFAAPGNAGIAALAECVDLAATDVAGLLAFAERESIDLTVVGPEAPLVAGIVDAFRAAGKKIFGPTAAAARIEGSKAFAKDLCRRYHIPTGSFRVFKDADSARRHVALLEQYPVVLKADGLAAGKGVVIAKGRAEAEAAIDSMMVAKEFGDAGRHLVIEEFLQGSEASVLAIVDGRTIAVLEPARDHKAAYDHDRGPNTGGMGAVSPARAVTRAILAEVEEQVLVPAVHGMARDGRPFQGFLYAGLMLTPGGPKVLEFNARLGDPETQAILPRLETDLLGLLALAVDQKLEQAGELEFDRRAACCVVLAAGGYPGAYRTGDPIEGLDLAAAEPDVQVFHAGTARKNGRVVTSGGRVLGITALGADVKTACERAYRAVGKIRFQDAMFRSDIGRAEYEGGRTP